MYYQQQPIQQQPQMQQQPMYSIQDQMNQSQQQIFSVNNSTNDQQKSQTNSPYKNEKNQQATRQSQRMKNIRDSKKSDVILFFYEYALFLFEWRSSQFFLNITESGHGKHIFR